MTSKHLGKLILIGIVFIAVFGYVVFRAWGGTFIDITLKTNAALEQGLVGHWSMDGKDVDTSSSTAEVRDRSGQGNNGNFVAPITFRAASSAATATGGATSLTINKPTGVVDNDVMVAALEVSYDTAITAPAGWTLVRSDFQNDGTDVNEFRLAIYYKTALSEGASYTWTFGASQRASGGIVAYLGVNTVTPVDVEAVQANASSVSVTAPSITTTMGDTRLVFIGTVGYWDSTYTPPTGMTERVDVSVGTDWGSITIADEARAAIGATGTRVGTASATKPNRGALLALKPAIVTAPGKIGQALSFDGVDDDVEIGDSNSLDFGDVFTMALWIKRSSINASVYETLFSKNVGGPTITINANNSPSGATDDTLSFYKDSGGLIVTATGTFADTDWHHVVITKNEGTVKIYIDNVDRTGTVTNQTIVNNNFPIHLSSESGTSPTSNYYNGLIDDVRIYSRALSTSEISRLYNLGATTHIGVTLNTNPDLGNGLVGHWTFDGAKMFSNVGDSSGQGNNGTLSGEGITFRAASSATNSSYAETSVTVSKPTGTTEGDVMIAALGWDANGSITAPSGWTLIRSTLFNTDNNVAAWYKVAGASEPANYTWSQPGNDDFSVGIATYYNIDTSNPINVENAQENSASSNVIAPSVTTTVANTMLVFVGGIDHNNVGNTWTPPSGMNERVDQSNTWTSIEIADVIKTSAGSTGTKTAVTTDSTANVGHLIALNPVSASTVPGRIGQALSFDGVDDFVSVPSSTAFDFASTGGFSFFTWFKKDSVCSNAEGTTEVFANRFGSDHGVKTWWFGCATGGATPGKLAIDLIPGGAEVGGYVHSQNAVNDGAWHYGGWVYDGSANQVRLYLDGVLQGASTTAFTVSFNVANPICLGSYGTNCNGKLDDGGAYEADGLFDDARVYNRALSAAEISRLYNLGATTHINTTLNTNPDLGNGLVGHWSFDGKDMSTVLSESFSGSTFPPATTCTSGWTTGGNANWTRDTGTSNTAPASANSGVIGDLEGSWIECVVSVSVPSTLSFNWKVSSESTYDFLHLCIDQTSTDCDGVYDTGYDQRISGEVDWTTVTKALSAGTHTLRWLYAKDENTTGGTDEGWIDDIAIDAYLATDRSGQGNTGTSTGVFLTPGRIGQAILFDGVDDEDYVNVGNNSSLQLTGAMTVSAWVNTSSASSNGRIVSKVDWTGTPNKGWELVMEGNSDVNFYLMNTSGTYFAVNVASQPTEEWRHYVAVYKPSTSMEMYVNGVSGAINTTSIPSAIANSDYPVYIGQRPDFDCCEIAGAIDDVRVYNRALSAAEILRLYQLGK